MGIPKGDTVRSLPSGQVLRKFSEKNLETMFKEGIVA
jgi:hypothetical protein